MATLGCKLNQADSAALEARLRLMGFERAAGGGGVAPELGADLVIVNTCTVTATPTARRGRSSGACAAPTRTPW